MIRRFRWLPWALVVLASTIASLQTRLRDEVDLDQLNSDLLGVVQGTVQPAHMSVWLRGEESRI